MAGQNQQHKPSGIINVRTWIGLALIACGLTASPLPAASAEEQESETQSSRQLYNKGTQKLREGKFREAESFLQSAVSGQNEKVQGSALYNLGHVRFKTGLEELKKAP